MLSKEITHFIKYETKIELREGKAEKYILYLEVKYCYNLFLLLVLQIMNTNSIILGEAFLLKIKTHA